MPTCAARPHTDPRGAETALLDNQVQLMAEVDLALALAGATSLRELDRSWISAVTLEDALRSPAAPVGAA